VRYRLFPPPCIRRRPNARQQLGTRSRTRPALAELTTHLICQRAQCGVRFALTEPAAKSCSVHRIKPLVLVDQSHGRSPALKNAWWRWAFKSDGVFERCRGWLPITQIGSCDARAELHSMRARSEDAPRGRHLAGRFRPACDVLRTTYPTLDGTGVIVAPCRTVTTAYPTYARSCDQLRAERLHNTASADVSSADLPSAVTVALEASCMITVRLRSCPSVMKACHVADRSRRGAWSEPGVLYAEMASPDLRAALSKLQTDIHAQVM